jgi:hypothetical protein
MPNTVVGRPTDRFGIKEVANVQFYAYTSTGVATTPCLTLDTLKVSNIEFTSEQTEARGGRGNAPLIIWDYGREATVTLQDALLSMETLSLLFAESVAANGTSIEISAETFPGTYKVVGETLARGEDGIDDIFTWTIEKAKVQSNVTLTMEAEGEPTVLDITLRVLRGENGKMMTLSKAGNTQAQG